MITGKLRVTITIKAATQIASVSRRTIYNWMRDEKIEFTRTAGGARRIFLDTLFKDDLIEEKKNDLA